MDRGDDDKNYMKKKGTKHVIHYNLNPSNQLLFEDQLKKCLNKYDGVGVKFTKSKYAPRNKHSPFGDFPSEYMPQKTANFDLINIDSHQVAHDSIDRVAKAKAGVTKIQAFTSLKKETFDKPPRAGALNPRKISVSDFRLHYDRGDLPILVQHERGTTIKWKDPTFEKFNFQLYLPIFVDGIREKTDPYRFLAIQGTFDLLEHVKDNVVKVIPQLILPLKAALNTRDVEIIAVALKVMIINFYF
jgi:Parkin co-regulated protein